MYAEQDRINDFDYFIENYQEIYKMYGHKFVAIRQKVILGVFNSVMDAINTLSFEYNVGTYIIQECNGDESAYRTNIMRLIIKG